MKKSVYSLVLMDDVIERIDREAYRMGVSRSALINLILADHVSFETPQKRSRQVLSLLEKNFSEPFVILPRQSDTAFNLKRALNYKYNPTVNYSVNFTVSDSANFGELKISLRSQNRSLLDRLENFFLLWAGVESKYISPPDRDFYRTGRGFMIRKLYAPKGASTENISRIVREYVSLFDTCLQYYFTTSDSDREAVRKIDAKYREYLNN